MPEESAATTFLFSDIEGSTRLWEQLPDRMRQALAHHDRIARSAVTEHHGSVVKSTGDGIHAAFDNAADAVHAALQLQLALSDAGTTGGLLLSVRCGLHAGTHQRRDNDFFGSEVNRAARVMSVAHGGQTLLSRAVADRVADGLPSGVTLRDLGRVRLRDLTSPEHVYQLVHPQLRADFPPLRSLEATPNNLAQQLNSFVGREREAAEVKAMLAANRLVTLLGMGGIGKSRLSVQLGAEVMDDYADGVWLVELAPLSDPQLVAQAVASVLGVKEEAGRPVVDALVKFVKDRQLLIILDNCEHVVHACAELTKQLLQVGSGLKMLASSRDPLQIAGETAYHVPALSAPQPKKKVTLKELNQHEAVRLFIDRATAAQPAFKLTEKNASAVADICHRLDGIPLALELAAARARTLSVEAISARLTDRFRLLVTGDQTVLPRQRTLRALIDWSYDLLASNERAVFQRLSVFAGGWTLEAAEAVCADGEVETMDVMDLLSLLVEKSLAVMDADGARYRMLETVRQYAQERLREANSEDTVRARHLTYHLGFAEKVRPSLFGPEQALWLTSLDNELENFLAAHAAAEAVQSGAELDLRLVYALRPYWVNRGVPGLGQQLTLEALQRKGAEGRNLDRCKALFVAGQLHSFMGQYGEAEPFMEESLSIARELDHKPTIAAALQMLGMASSALGRLDRARTFCEEGLNLARTLGNRREVAAALIALAQLYRVEGSARLAQPLYQQAIDIAQKLGDQQVVAIGLLNLCMVAIDGDHSNGVSHMLLEILEIAAHTGSQPVGQSVLEVCAGLAALLQEWHQAARLYGAAEAQATRSGLRRDAADEAFLLPRMKLTREALGDPSFTSSVALGKALNYEQGLDEARIWVSGRT